MGSPASSFSAPASRSATWRLFTNKIVELRTRMISSRRGWMAFQMDTRFGDCEAGPLGRYSCSPRRAMSSTGTSMRSFNCLRALALTMVTGR